MILAVTELPPLGWEYFSDLENRFPLTGESVGSTGGSNFHTHSAEFFTFTKASDESSSGNSLQISPVSATLSEESNLPEYTTVIYAKRKTSINVSVEEEETNTKDEEGKNSSITGVEDKESNTGTTDDGNVKGASTAIPTYLQVEGQEEPDSVTDTTPEFTAIFNDPDTGDTGVYYRVQVGLWSVFPDTLVWDSGKVAMTSTAIGARCPEITYAGSALVYNGNTYYWRIKFWDNGGNETDWSEIYVFTMAGGGKPSNVLIDNGTNPSFLVSASPIFTAICTDSNGDNCSAYQIEVNTSSNFSGTEYWNSGKVSLSITNNARSSDITYKGTPLTNSGTTLYWRMLLWDTNDISDSTGATGSFVDSYPSFDLSGVKLEGIKIN